MPHLHLSVQAGDDLILKRMKRRHLREDVIRIAARLRELRPDIVLGADIIAGFPTETEVMFQRSLDLVAEAGLTHLHVFPYSEREGTPAARMPQVAKADRKRRAALLRAAGEAAVKRFAETRIGLTEQVLIEKDNAGLTQHFLPMLVEGPSKPGDIVETMATSLDGDGRLRGATRDEVAA